MSKSPFLKPVAERLPTEFVITVALTFSVYQALCCVFGGSPSIFIKNRDHQFNWYTARIVGMVTTSIYFCFVMFLLSSKQITAGTVLYAAAGLTCFTGSHRLYKKMRADYEYSQLKKVINDIDFLRRVGVLAHEPRPGDI